MAEPLVVILADDLTGAADTGGAFAAAGLVTVLPLCDSAIPPADIVALSSECRDLAECDAAGRAAAALDRARSAGVPAFWYRKVDSALRGHPGLEIELTMRELGKTTAIVAPALPAEGRTTRDARVLVHGLPLHTTQLGAATSTSFVVDHLRRHVTARIGAVGLAVVRRGSDALAAAIAAFEPAVVVVDAETDEDLLTIARVSALRPDALIVGSAGLATALRSVLTPISRVPPPPGAVRRDAPVLVVAGTRHEATARQIDYAEVHGTALVRPERVEALADPRSRHELQQRVCASLAAGQNTMLTITGSPRSEIPGHELAAWLAEVAAAPCRNGLASGLFLTGGDVAAAVCALLDVDYLWLHGEVAPAIPWATLGTGPLARTPVVTKAGSFGGRNAIADALTFLTSIA